MYIHKTNPTWETDKLPTSYRVATNEEEFKQGGYYKLSAKQIKFRKDNPAASGLEIIRMKLNEVSEPAISDPLQDAINAKLSEIDQYDNSEAVNSFLVNNAPCWIPVAQRSIYRTSVESAELLGEQTIELELGGQFITLPIQNAKMLLAQIQRYADKSAIITAKHKAGVSVLESIEEVDGYDFTAGYPEKVTINL